MPLPGVEGPKLTFDVINMPPATEPTKREAEAMNWIRPVAALLRKKGAKHFTGDDCRRGRRSLGRRKHFTLRDSCGPRFLRTTRFAHHAIRTFGRSLEVFSVGTVLSPQVRSSGRLWSECPHLRRYSLLRRCVRLGDSGFLTPPQVRSSGRLWLCHPTHSFLRRCVRLGDSGRSAPAFDVPVQDFCGDSLHNHRANVLVPGHLLYGERGGER